MRWMLWASLSFVGLTIGTVFAQDAAPPTNHAADARVVRVRIGHTGGLCGGFGYCTGITTVEPSFIVRESMNAANKKTFPDTKAERAITKQDWENLERAIDTKSLMALPQPTCCRACIDLPDSWVEVKFSSGTKISVSYDPGNPPAPIAALLHEIETIGARPKRW
jgi:hypothetical protein